MLKISIRPTLVLSDPHLLLPPRPGVRVALPHRAPRVDAHAPALGPRQRLGLGALLLRARRAVLRRFVARTDARNPPFSPGRPETSVDF